MAKAKKGNFLFDRLMPMVYGIGASIVIVGAMFKIMHWDGADTMLIVGLSTEAVIFFLSAFQPQSHEVDWARVYPQLADDNYELKANNTGLTAKLDDMLADANVTPEAIGNLGMGLNRLSQTAGQMSDLTDATVATKEYATKVRTAAGSLEKINGAYAETVDAMKQMTGASANAKEYHLQVQNMTKNLGALNAVYEMELQDANNHLKSLNKFYGSLSSAMENLTDASRDTEQFKAEVAGLTKNLHALNNVYGNMLNAMRA
jgi:gliding motility-associated protein GldL